ncbi:MAG: response regulator [Sphingomonadales bacterium]|nr:response regulator [Sphingomonadales bacterium]
MSLAGQTPTEAGASGPALLDKAALGFGLVLSLGIVWLASHQPLVVAGFAAGALLLLGAMRLLPTLHRREDADTFAEPDWSVTVAAIDHPDCAVAVTDRAGRLVCANRLFESWFGVDRAPPALGMGIEPGSAERLARAGRDAWRDGKAVIDRIERGTREQAVAQAASVPGRWHGEVQRAGRAEDFLVWRLLPLADRDPIADLVTQLDGKMGRALAAAGLSAAIVDPDGRIRAASVGFAERALGDPLAAAAHRDFVGLLAQDDQDRLYWAHDVQRGSPLTLFHIPLGDPDAPGAHDPATTPSLMVLADSGVGLGGDAVTASAAPHLEGLLAQLPLGLAMADRDGRLLFANAAFMRAAGRDGQPAPTYPTDLVVREDKAALSDAVRRFAQGSASAGDIAVRLIGQPDEPISLSLAGVRGLGEAAVLLSLADTSEETRLKRQVAQATKMQAVGQLAGGVAHDFNNVLTAIIGTCDLMMLRHMPGDSDYDDIQQIRASSNRAASLTRHLLAFSRQQTLRPEVLQLPDVVSEVSQMLKRLIGEKISLEVTHDRDLGAIRADPTQLEQVIVNLAVNARDAIQEHGQDQGQKPGLKGDGGGRVVIATRRITAADVRAMRSDILPIADYTALLVEDTGGGIPEDVLPKIFEPFYTTKEMGKGTGLGLSTVYGIVKQSGGFIFADNIAGKPKGATDKAERGARFSIYLPVHQPAPGEPVQTPARKPAEAPSNWAGGGAILLVEDEDSVRMVAERALVRAGYTVTLARDGEDGLDRLAERLESGQGLFDLVVSDVVMPGMDGPAMVRAMRLREPALPVLFMSGHAEEQLRREIDVEDAQFLGKPFSVQQICDKVAGVLAAAK